MSGGNSSVDAERASLGKLVWVVPLATAVATTANVILYFIITRWFGNDLIVGGAQTAFHRGEVNHDRANDAVIESFLVGSRSCSFRATGLGCAARI